MVKKLKQMAEKQAAAPRLFDSALAAQVKDSAQQIWLAGMGAFSRAQAEGTKVFETLVKEGASLQKKTKADVEEKIGTVTGNAARDVHVVNTLGPRPLAFTDMLVVRGPAAFPH